MPLVALSARRSVPPGSVGARPPPCPHLSTLRSTICSQVTVTIPYSGACSTLQCKVFHCTMFIVQISSICHWAVVAWEVENLWVLDLHAVSAVHCHVCLDGNSIEIVSVWVQSELIIESLKDYARGNVHPIPVLWSVLFYSFIITERLIDLAWKYAAVCPSALCPAEESQMKWTGNAQATIISKIIFTLWMVYIVFFFLIFICNTMLEYQKREIECTCIN